MVIQPLSTRLIKPNFCLLKSHCRPSAELCNCILGFMKVTIMIKLITNRWAWVLVPIKLVEPHNALAWGGGLRGNPASSPHQALSHWTIQWNTYRCTTYLTHASRGREGWENQSTNYYANDKLLRSLGKNCEWETAYVSHEVPLLVTLGQP